MGSPTRSNKHPLVGRRKRKAERHCIDDAVPLVCECSTKTEMRSTQGPENRATFTRRQHFGAPALRRRSHFSVAVTSGRSTDTRIAVDKAIERRLLTIRGALTTVVPSFLDNTVTAPGSNDSRRPMTLNPWINVVEVRAQSRPLRSPHPRRAKRAAGMAHTPRVMFLSVSRGNIMIGMIWKIAMKTSHQGSDFFTPNSLLY